jgi:hypothetical protein
MRTYTLDISLDRETWATPLHFRSIRLFNNAGIDFPVCYAGARLLDLDKSRLPTTGDANKVTCKRCQRRIVAITRKAAPIK